MTDMIDLTMDLTDALSLFTPDNIEHFTPRLVGHVGTHIDIMETSGLEPSRFISTAHIIDVAGIFDRPISLTDCNFSNLTINATDSIIFHTQWSKQQRTRKTYFSDHPYLDTEVIDYLLAQQVNLIAIDAPGIKRGKEHKAIDEYCATNGVFVVENLINLELLDENKKSTLYCFPLKFSQNTGVTCRVTVAQS